MDMRITSKGQVTIPLAIREKYGFLPETDIEFIEKEDWIGIRRTQGSKPDQVDRFIQRLTGSATGTLTTDEMMELSRGYAAEG